MVFYGNYFQLNKIYMDIIKSFRLQFAKKSVKFLIALVLLIVFSAFFLMGNKENATQTSFDVPVVSLTTASEYAGEQSLSLIGSVRAFTEADITSEISGRVVSVNVNLGQEVGAGTILATLENASEAASVLQAQGVYEAAVAGAEQSKLGVSEAQTSLDAAKDLAITSMKGAYNTTNGVVVNNIDNFFADPNSRIPGLRVSGKGFTQQLNNERVAFQTLLPEWKIEVNSFTKSDELLAGLDSSISKTNRAIDIIDTLLIVLNDDDDNSSEFANSEVELVALKSTLNAVVSDLNAAKSRIEASTDGLNRAVSNATGAVTSAADAQVKQALGSLRSAQANYAKTILRTPISGTVNSISIRQGDYVAAFSKVAVVANNSALEIVTYISDSEKALIMEGDTVLIESEYEGVVTQIAPAVDSTTRKTELRIAIEGAEISNGDTVQITRKVSSTQSVVKNVSVPLTAIRFDRENGFIFTVESETLLSRPVVLGNILGNSVVVEEGLALDEEFVVDARGLVDGQEVEISN